MNALSQKPLLVKPNNHELAELYHTTLQVLKIFYLMDIGY